MHPCYVKSAFCKEIMCLLLVFIVFLQSVLTELLTESYFVCLRNVDSFCFILALIINSYRKLSNNLNRVMLKSYPFLSHSGHDPECMCMCMNGVS